MKAEDLQAYSKIIGWGSGELFEINYPSFPAPIAYLLDNNPDKWGTFCQGLEICPPDALLKETPEETLVVIFSQFIGPITKQVRALGGYHVQYAGDFMLSDYEERVERFEQALAGTVLPDRAPATDRAIVLQGPVADGLTSQILKYYAIKYPQDRIVLSTWEGTSEALLAQVAPFADDIVLSPEPACFGYGNRNAQIVSARAGIQKAREQGAKRIMKTRTDLVWLKDNALDECERALNEYGLAGRILIPQSFTFKYRLYHPSDLVMYADADTMAAFWDTELDPREGSHPVFQDRENLSIYEGCVEHQVFSEAYLGVQYARRVGWELKGTLEDSWAFLRDCFLVQDDAWFEFIWFKYKNLPLGGSKKVDHAFWSGLHQGLQPDDSFDVHEEKCSYVRGGNG